MKVLAICGSPRKGNTEAMLKEVLRGAENAGAATELVLLRELDIEQCKGCEKCGDGKPCIIKDDAEKIFEKIFKADAVVFGSPNYFNNVPALMKNFIDRTDPYWQDKRLKGKKVFAVCAGGTEADSPKNVIQEYAEICQMDLIKSVKAVAGSAGEVGKDKQKMLECFELGKYINKLVE